MEDGSFFMNKSAIPADDELVSALKSSHPLWMQIQDFVLEKYPAGRSEWNFPGKKYGWSYRIKDKKRAIIYFLPRDGYFKVAFVFGQKATEMVLNSDVSPLIKTELTNATQYAEGRGIRIEVNNEKDIVDIKKLVEIKLMN
jgi:hypothetical protein